MKNYKTIAEEWIEKELTKYPDFNIGKMEVINRYAKVWVLDFANHLQSLVECDPKTEIHSHTGIYLTACVPNCPQKWKPPMQYDDPPQPQKEIEELHPIELSANMGNPLEIYNNFVILRDKLNELIKKQ